MQKDLRERAEDRLQASQDILAACTAQLDSLSMERDHRIGELEATIGAKESAVVEGAKEADRLRFLVERQGVSLRHLNGVVARQTDQLRSVTEQRDAAIAAQNRSLETLRQQAVDLAIAQRSAKDAIEKARVEDEAASLKMAELRSKITELSAPRETQRHPEATDDEVREQLLHALRRFDQLTIVTTRRDAATGADVDMTPTTRSLCERLERAMVVRRS